MNIKPIAKRVRFRIVSSGVECTSLDELKEHFEPKSVFSAIQDGRLEKWLKAIGEDKFAIEMAKHLPKDFSNTEQCLEFLSFFITGNVLRRSAYKTHLEYFQELCKIKELKDYVRQMIASDLASKTDVDLLLFAYKKGFVDDAQKAFRKYIKDKTYERHSDLFYVYGKALEKEGDTQTARKYIKKSIQLGNKEAEEYLNTHPVVNNYLVKEIEALIVKSFNRALNANPNKGRYTKIENFIKDNPYWIDNLFECACNQFNFQKKRFEGSTSDCKKYAAMDLCHLCCDSVINFNKQSNLLMSSGQDFKDFLHNEYLFVRTYYRECEYKYYHNDQVRNEVIADYNKLINFPPALQRAELLHSDITNHMNIKLKLSNNSIPMPHECSPASYAEFIYRYLTNLFNIEGSELSSTKTNNQPLKRFLPFI